MCVCEAECGVWRRQGERGAYTLRGESKRKRTEKGALPGEGEGGREGVRESGRSEEEREREGEIEGREAARHARAVRHVTEATLCTPVSPHAHPLPVHTTAHAAQHRGRGQEEEG
eukprot:3372212-Rhodomonas_salina.1